MPELPEVEALAAYLRDQTIGRTIKKVDIAAVSALKTFDPPLVALTDCEITDVSRQGKFLDLDISGLHLVVHLARAGWLQFRPKLGAQLIRPGKGPLAARFHLDNDSGFDLTEAGTHKGLAIYLVRDPADVPGIARLGPDAMNLDFSTFQELVRKTSGQIKRVITDQKIIAGVGNAYSDEILHAAKLSPFATSSRLTEDQIERLFNALREILSEAISRSVGQESALLKAEKRIGLRVHGRSRQPCPVCGDSIQDIAFADKSWQYCPTCQTNGRPLADRRLSKFLR